MRWTLQTLILGVQPWFIQTFMPEYAIFRRTSKLGSTSCNFCSGVDKKSRGVELPEVHSTLDTCLMSDTTKSYNNRVLSQSTGSDRSNNLWQHIATDVGQMVTYCCCELRSKQASFLISCFCVFVFKRSFFYLVSNR